MKKKIQKKRKKISTRHLGLNKPKSQDTDVQSVFFSYVYGVCIILFLDNNNKLIENSNRIRLLFLFFFLCMYVCVCVSIILVSKTVFTHTHTSWILYIIIRHLKKKENENRKKSYFSLVSWKVDFFLILGFLYVTSIFLCSAKWNQKNPKENSVSKYTLKYTHTIDDCWNVLCWNTTWTLINVWKKRKKISLLSLSKQPEKKHDKNDDDEK